MTASKKSTAKVVKSFSLEQRAKLICSLRKHTTPKTYQYILKSLVKEREKELKKLAVARKRLQKLKDKGFVTGKIKSRVVKVKVKAKAKIVKRRNLKPLQKPDDLNSDWSGNSDDEGSVDSGVLDEEICFDCGKRVIRRKEFESLINCDICDSLWHLNCAGLEMHPRVKFNCRRCVEEQIGFENMDYKVDAKRFKVQ